MSSHRKTGKTPFRARAEETRCDKVGRPMPSDVRASRRRGGRHSFHRSRPRTRRRPLQKPPAEMHSAPGRRHFPEVFGKRGRGEKSPFSKEFSHRPRNGLLTPASHPANFNRFSAQRQTRNTRPKCHPLAPALPLYKKQTVPNKQSPHIYSSRNLPKIGSPHVDFSCSFLKQSPAETA